MTVLYQDIGDTTGVRGGDTSGSLCTQVKKLTTAGTFSLDKVHYKVDGRRALEEVLGITDGDKITVADLHGEILIEHTRPGPGVTHVGNRRPRQPKTSRTSPMS